MSEQLADEDAPELEQPVDEDVAPADADPFAWRPVRRRGLGRHLEDITSPAARTARGKGLAALIPTEPVGSYAPPAPRRTAGFAAPAPEPPAPVQVPAPSEPQPTPELGAAVQVPPAVLAATLSAPRRVETEWLVAPRLDAALHHADLGLHAVHDLALDEQHRVPKSAAILLACGEITRAVSFPAPWQRTDAVRCPGCCDALSYPHGTGSPVNDDGCRTVLAQRFAEQA